MEKIMITFFLIEKYNLEHDAHNRVWRGIFHKSKSPFQKWTFFLSNFQNPKYFSAKMHAFLLLLLYRDHLNINNNNYFITSCRNKINAFYFLYFLSFLVFFE